MTAEVVARPAPAGSPEWQRMITASKIPVILGLSPFQTPGELWMTMSGLADPEVLEGDHLEWGHVIEESLARWWAKKHPGWQINAGEIAYTDPDLPFPNQSLLDRRGRRGRRFHIVECKSSDSTDTWSDPDLLPGHVAAQVLSQEGISGIREGSVVAQLYSTVPKIYPVEFDAGIWEGIVDVVAGFYRSLDNSEPPAPPADLLDALRAANKPIDGKVIVDADVDLLDRYRATRDALKAAEADHDDAKAALLDQLRTAGGNTLKHDGKIVASLSAGRFSAKRVPDEARHLLTDQSVMSPKLDTKKLADTYPDVYALGVETSARFY